VYFSDAIAVYFGTLMIVVPLVRPVVAVSDGGTDVSSACV
jgi:hypothetical protein